MDGKWLHDRYDEHEQAPKTTAEIIEAHIRSRDRPTLPASPTRNGVEKCSSSSSVSNMDSIKFQIHSPVGASRQKVLDICFAEYGPGNLFCFYCLKAFKLASQLNRHSKESKHMMRLCYHCYFVISPKHYNAHKCGVPSKERYAPLVDANCSSRMDENRSHSGKSQSSSHYHAGSSTHYSSLREKKDKTGSSGRSSFLPGYSSRPESRDAIRVHASSSDSRKRKPHDSRRSQSSNHHHTGSSTRYSSLREKKDKTGSSNRSSFLPGYSSRPESHDAISVHASSSNSRKRKRHDSSSSGSDRSLERRRVEPHQKRQHTARKSVSPYSKLRHHTRFTRFKRKNGGSVKQAESSKFMIEQVVRAERTSSEKSVSNEPDSAYETVLNWRCESGSENEFIGLSNHPLTALQPAASVVSCSKELSDTVCIQPNSSDTWSASSSSAGPNLCAAPNDQPITTDLFIPFTNDDEPIEHSQKTTEFVLLSCSIDVSEDPRRLYPLYSVVKIQTLANDEPVDLRVHRPALNLPLPPFAFAKKTILNKVKEEQKAESKSYDVLQRQSIFQKRFSKRKLEQGAAVTVKEENGSPDIVLID